MSEHEEHYRRKLKYAASINDDVLSEDTKQDYELQYIDIGNVYSSGSVKDPVVYQFKDAPSRARRRVRDGDIIISCVRTYLQAIAPIRNPPANLVVSTGFAVVRPSAKTLDPRFASYALREPSFLAEIQRRSVGVNYPAINSSDLADISIHLPPLQEQRRIADYLDRELARLDALVLENERVLELLVEKRQALTANAVTRGIDPDVSLRTSGVPWLGDIPAHWEIERARWLFNERDERSSTGDEELLTVSHLTGVTARSEKQVYMFEAETTEGYKVCLENDLVINTLWAWMGAMGVTQLKGIVSPSYHVYELATQRLYPGFVDALVRISVFAQEVTRYSKGVWSSRLRLYPQAFFEVFLPIPPKEEQQEILMFLQDKQRRLEDLNAEAQKAIALLRERRAALIAGAMASQLRMK